MNYFSFSHPLKKAIQVSILLAMIFLNFGAGGVSVAYAAPPANDTFATAEDVNTIPFTDTISAASILDATPVDPETLPSVEPAVPIDCDGRRLDAGVKTVWYRYTAAASGLVYADSFGSGYDTYIAVWTGSDLNSLTIVACDDDQAYQGSILQSQVIFNATAGTVYYIQVAGYAGTTIPDSPNQPNPGGTLQFHVNFPNIDITIGTTLMGEYYLPGGMGHRASYASTNNGPIELVNLNGVSTMAAERVIYHVNGFPTSFSEMMGLPHNQLDTTYWMPWYNNVELDTQLRFGNVSGSTATVRLFIGGVEKVTGCLPANIPYPIQLAPGASLRVSCAGVNDGPVQIVSNVNIVAAERVIYHVNGFPTSFSEMMGLPASQLDTTYWMPWYNNVELDTQLRFGNVSGSTATVRLFIGGVEKATGCLPPSIPYPIQLAPGASLRVSCAGVNDGPVQVVSNVDIVAAERVIYHVNGFPASFSEMMGLPNGQLGNTYWMPWYNNVDLDTQLRFGNVSGSTATVRLFIGGVEMTTGCLPPSIPYPIQLASGASLRVSCAGVDSGPVKVVSNVDIVAAERVIYNVNGFPTSFSEMMGLPDNLLSTRYWFPWYNNIELDTQLRFGMP